MIEHRYHLLGTGGSPLLPGVEGQGSRGARPLASTREEVKDFLFEMKIAMSQRRPSFAEREKNMAALAELGILPQEVPGILGKLEVSDYWDGPLADDKGRPKTWWIFGPDYEGSR